jgi:sugar O-acyltransferase (sialic acid O-acetyltransferase NeuD family)
MQNYIYGAGGHGKVVLDAMQVSRIDCTGFVDDKEISTWVGLKVYHPSALDLDAEIYLHLAVGNSKAREAIATRLIKARFFSISHPAAIIAKSAQIGSGTFIAAQSIVAPDVQIGNHCIINHAAVVDHDCLVGDYTHIASQTSLGGGVKVGKGVLIGSGAVVLPGITIANYAIIGAGAVVTKNVAEGITVIGSPAKSI